MDKWKKIEPGVWKPESEGENIVGVLIKKEPRDEKANLSAKYYIENENGTWLVWGCAVIDDRMKHVEIGSKVRITFEGKTKNKRNYAVNLYQVEVAENHESDNSEDKEQ